MNNLQPGITYDKDRHRYCVRVYRQNEIRHLSYHDDLEDATRTWNMTRNHHEKSEVQVLLDQTRAYFQNLAGRERVCA
jgi:hypothetical protein